MFVKESKWMHHLNNVFSYSDQMESKNSGIDVTKCVKIHNFTHFYINKVTNLMKYNPRHTLPEQLFVMTSSPNISLGWFSYEWLSVVESLDRSGYRPMARWRVRRSTAQTLPHTHIWSARIRIWRVHIPLIKLMSSYLKNILLNHLVINQSLLKF